MGSRDWTPRDKAVKKAAKLLMKRWGADGFPRAMREALWLEAREDAEAIFKLAEGVVSETAVSEVGATLPEGLCGIPNVITGIGSCVFTPHTEGKHSWEQ